MSGLRVKVVLAEPINPIGARGSDVEIELGVFNQGVVTENSRLVDVATGQSIAIRNVTGAWLPLVRVNRDHGGYYRRMFIQAVS